MEQITKDGFRVEVVPSEVTKGLKRNYGGEIKVYLGDELVDEAWIVISKNGIARLGRVE